MGHQIQRVYPNDLSLGRSTIILPHLLRPAWLLARVSSLLLQYLDVLSPLLQTAPTLHIASALSDSAAIIMASIVVARSLSVSFDGRLLIPFWFSGRGLGSRIESGQLTRLAKRGVTHVLL